MSEARSVTEPPNLILSPVWDRPRTGTQFLSGDHACTEGALYAG